MRRFKIGLGVAAAAFLLLAWVWPDGSGTVEQREAASDQSASVSPSATEGTEADEPDEDDAPESSEPPPSEEPEPGPDGAERPVATEDSYDGPLGTRNRTGDDTVALTFDDGPDPEWTPKVLAELRGRGVKATFCVIGAYAEANPDLIADIVHDGHTLCSHAWYHEMDLGTWDEGAIRTNLQRTNDAVSKAAPGAEVEYFRQPGGQWTERVVGIAADMGMESLHWTVDPSDWDKDAGAGDIREHILDRCGPGSVILLHDGGANQKDMLTALEDILDEFERRDYTLVAL